MKRIYEKDWKNIEALIQGANKILLSTHVNPDGDGLGSQIAFYHYLQSLNKECKIINYSSFPPMYDIINPDLIVEQYSTNHDDWIATADLAVVFDIGSTQRLRDIYTLISKNKIKAITIDHHPSEHKGFEVAVVDSDASSTGILVWDYLNFTGLYKDGYPINIAKALYTALLTDTGSFRYSSTSPFCHAMASNLISCGVDPYEIYSSIYEQREKHQIELMALIIQSVQYSQDSKYAWVVITQEMLDLTGATPLDTEGTADFLRTIKGVEVSFVLIELLNGNLKISFRSRGKVVINDIAQYFAGGGHKFAAGAKVDGFATKDIVKKIQELLDMKLKGLK